MNFLYTTRRYFAQWTDCDPSVILSDGIHTVCTEKRDERQVGHSRTFHLYGLVTSQSAIISYSPSLKSHIEDITSTFRHSERDVLADELRGLLDIPVWHSVKFSFESVRRPSPVEALQLTPNDYPLFERFFRTQHPNSTTDWLEEYYRPIAARGLVHGVLVDGELVSATDAPSVPYLEDLIVEPGINTLADYRRRGYATSCVQSALRRILSEDQVPIWATSRTNVASAGLARRVGFVEFADVFTATLP